MRRLIPEDKVEAVVKALGRSMDDWNDLITKTNISQLEEQIECDKGDDSTILDVKIVE